MPVQLEIELRQISEPFTGEVLLTSDFESSGTEVSITSYGLSDGEYHCQYRVKDEHGATSDWKEFGTSGNIDFIVIKPINVHAIELSRYWRRDSITDLPICDFVINYKISNLGYSQLNNINLEIKVDDNIFIEDTIPTIDPGSDYENDFSLSIIYDNSSYIEINASFLSTSDIYVFTLEAILPRAAQNYGDLQKLYITPNDMIVLSTLGDILSSYPTFQDWEAIRDWTATFINYKEDQDLGYYQLPRETIQKGEGDCEDFATLYVSLLRANGWNSEDVYAVYGRNSDNQYHMWVRINLGSPTGWYTLEPQIDTWCTFIGDFIILFDYHALFMFNDLEYNETELLIETQSPVDIIVKDPDGLIISKQLNEISGTIYNEVDPNGNGDLHDHIIIFNKKVGDYKITIIPEAGASPTDTYSLIISGKDTISTLAKDIYISNIPSEPYVIQASDLNIPPTTCVDFGDPKLIKDDITFLTSNSLIKLIAEDNSGGSGVHLTSYRIFNSNYDSSWINYSSTFYLDTLNGYYNMAFNSTDNCGNIENTQTIQIHLGNIPQEEDPEEPTSGGGDGGGGDGGGGGKSDDENIPGQSSKEIPIQMFVIIIASISAGIIGFGYYYYSNSKEKRDK